MNLKTAFEQLHLTLRTQIVSTEKTTPSQGCSSQSRGSTSYHLQLTCILIIEKRLGRQKRWTWTELPFKLRTQTHNLTLDLKKLL